MTEHSFHAGVEALRDLLLKDGDKNNGSSLCVESGYWPNARRYLSSLTPAPPTPNQEAHWTDRFVGMPLTGEHLSDAEIATHVRMLMRDDMDHEAVCVLARDRIAKLSRKLRDATAAEAKGRDATLRECAQIAKRHPDKTEHEHCETCRECTDQIAADIAALATLAPEGK